MLELRVAANNRRFRGVADLYVDHDVFHSISATLDGFPSSGTDHRDIELGSFADDSAGGGVRLHFRATDDLGHAVVDVEVSTGSQTSRFRSETADLVVPIEAAAVDEFVKAARKMRAEVGAKARLAGSN